MDSRVTTDSPTEIDADWLMVGIPEGAPWSATLQAIDQKLGGQLTRLKEAGDVTGKLAEAILIPDVPELAAARLLLVGLGEPRNLDRAAIRKAFATGALMASRKPNVSVACVIPSIADDQLDLAETAHEIATSLVVSGAGPGLYQAEQKRHPFAKVTFVVDDGRGGSAVESAVDTGAILGESVNLVRELVNRPAADVYPETFAQRASQLADELGLKCTILDEPLIQNEKMGSLLGVSAGSDRPPRVVLLSYEGAGDGQPVTALVGKGVTFDSGGLSLKPTASMNTMKSDMAGAATVLGTMAAIARLKLPVNVLGAVGLVENMISGSSYKLGDVLTARNGVTIEVLNTDAEGRLVLADVLSYVVDQNVNRMIDLATLTGSCVVALGENTTGAFTNDQSWCDEVLAAAERAGEQMWQLPMDAEFGDLLKSDVADIKNVGPRWGGASIAAKFLERFVADVPWVHLDIAGPSFADSSSADRDSGGTGVMVRSLVELFSGSKSTDQ